jgi:hypothetical protein
MNENYCPPESVVIRLTRGEAEAFLAVQLHVGGAPSTTGRGGMDSIARVLQDAGYKKSGTTTGSIFFEA